MRAKRAIAWILVLAALAVSAASCGKPNTPDGETTAAAETAAALGTTAADAVTTAAAPETEAYPALPEADFKDEEFIILVNNRSDDYHSVEFAAENVTGDVVNDAVFKRNTLVEEQYNVDLINTPVSKEAAALETNVLANVHAYDIALIGLTSAGSLALKNLLMDFGSIPHLYLEGPWWDQNATADLSLANRKYMTIGDMNINDKDMTWCMFFDKQLALDYHMPDLYALAANKEWTFDKFRELCENVSTDLNGDGQYDQNDLYAHVTVFARSTIAYMYSMNAMSFVKDADDLPQLNTNTDKLFDAYEVVRSLFFSDNLCHDIETMPYDGYANRWRKSEAMFGNKQILFYAEAMQNAERFRGFENDFGILPLPSGEAGSYGKHMVWKEAYVTVAPLTLSQSDALTERAGILLEAIMRASSDTVLPAYYDTALKTKFSRDDSSAAMIDIIFANRYYDIGTYYNWGEMNNTWMSLGKAGTESIASAIKIRQKTAERALEDCIANLTGGAK